MKSSLEDAQEDAPSPRARRPTPGTGHHDAPFRCAPRSAPAANPAATHSTARWSSDSMPALSKVSAAGGCRLCRARRANFSPDEKAFITIVTGHNIHILLLARAPFPPLMACCFLNKDADLTHFPTFVTPSAGETDACGKHCGPISYAFPTTQIVCCARDPYVRDADDAYDADGAKRMPVRCGVFMVLCLPLFALMEVGLTMYACVSPRSYKSCRGR